MLSFDSFILISALILAALSVYSFATFLLANNADSDQLAWASGSEPVKSGSSIINSLRPLVHNLTLKYAHRFFKNPKSRAKIEKAILTAGLSKELNVDEYIGFQILLGAFLPLLLLLLKFGLQMDFPVAFAFGLGAIGFMYPSIYCKQTKQSRYISVVSELPFFIDMLALSTEANMEFMNAIKRVVEKADPDGVLTKEFGQVLQEVSFGSSRDDALRAMAARLDMSEITSFTSIVIDSFATGASVSSVLKEQSIQMRQERFVRAEKAGAKASQVILFPMLFLIMPAVFIVIFAPVILGGGM